MVRPAELAGRPDFQLGPLSISPARRRVEGPAGAAQVEPLTMRLFLMLLDAGGQVVTRDALFEAGWGSAVVGDDSLNRVINRIRRIAAETGPGLFEIETVPRTGYRVTSDTLDLGGLRRVAEDKPAVSRRLVIGSAAAAGIAAAGGLGWWWNDRAQADAQLDSLLRRSERAYLFDDHEEGIRLARAAVRLRPDSARAQGQLAYLLIGDPDQPSSGSADAGASAGEEHLSRALALDPREPYARLAQTITQRSVLDLAEHEDRLLQILDDSPNHITAMRYLWGLYQSAGLSRRSATLIDKGLALEPLVPATHYPRAQLLWILGHNAEADRVIDRAMAQWPWHRFVRFARFTIYAFTDRAPAALAMLASEKTAPQSFKPEGIALWRKSLVAMQDPSAANVAMALKANVVAAKAMPSLSSQAVLALSALGEVDAAFEVANGFLVYRDAIARREAAPGTRPAARSTAWRFTPWLFTPPAAAMRADPRFLTLCEGIGLTEYWAKRGVKPDYQLGLT